MNETGLLGGRYQLGEILGHGGVSEVRRARDTRLGRDVAVKVLRDDLVDDEILRTRFRRRIELAATLSHPAIVSTYDVGETNTRAGSLPYLVMELVDGQTLRRILTLEGPLRERRAMEVMADICAGLNFAHRHGVTHETLSPAKVMIERSGAVKVLDFTGGPRGDEAGEFDVRSDVYAAGALLSELLTGVRPEAGRPSVQRNHSRLDEVVRTAMATNPAERYHSASAMRAALVELLTGEPAADTAPPPVAPTPPTEETPTEEAPVEPTRPAAAPPRPARTPVVVKARRRRPILLGLLGIILIVGIVWLATGLFGSGGTEPVAVPQLRGEPVAKVTNQLRELQLTPKQKQVPCQPKEDGGKAPCGPDQIGTVLRTDPEPGAELEPKSTVAVYVAAPAKQVTIPEDLAGKSEQEARDLLRGLGLRVTTDPQRLPVSDPSLVDHVVRTDPETGTPLAAGSEITLTIGSQAAPPTTTTTPPSSTSPTTPPPSADEQRGENGEGSYVCTQDKLYFASCNPDTLGKVVQYPAYN